MIIIIIAYVKWVFLTMLLNKHLMSYLIGQKDRK